MHDIKPYTPEEVISKAKPNFAIAAINKLLLESPYHIKTLYESDIIRESMNFLTEEDKKSFKDQSDLYRLKIADKAVNFFRDYGWDIAERVISHLYSSQTEYVFQPKPQTTTNPTTGNNQ